MCTQERIQRWRCEACGQTATARLNTVLYGLKTPSWRVAEVSTALAEGVDIAAASRMFGHRERTIGRWLERSGQHAQRLPEHVFVHLVCNHLQLDELVTKVRGVSERVWVWVAIEAQTKIVPVIHIGRRKHDDAQRFVHEIWQRLAEGCLPVFTSDGLNHYFYALTAHFGQWVAQTGHRLPVWQVSSGLLYGQLHKVKVGYRLKTLYTSALCGTSSQLREALQALGLSGRIMTAYVERFNLTLRELVAPLSRRTWSIACNQTSLAHRVVALVLSLRSSARVFALANGTAAALSLSHPRYGCRADPPPLARQGTPPAAGLSCLTDKITLRRVPDARGFPLYLAITDPC